MNIQSPGMDISQSIQDMGKLLKNISSESMDMQKKLMNVTVEEQLSDPNLGNKLDMMA